MKSLSLYVIEDALLELTSAREQLLEDLNQHLDASSLEQQAEKQQELKAVDALLAQYVTLETRKVDNIHSLLQWSKDTAAAARVHASEFLERARMIEDTAKRVKQLVLDVMTVAGKKTVDGTAGRKLARQGNGGLQPLQVDGWNEETKQWTMDPAPLPDEFMDVVVSMPRPLYLEVLKAATERGFKEHAMQFMQVLATKPSGDRLRVALAEPCPACGAAEVCNCGESMNGYHDTHTPVQMICDACDGTGRQKIPGARLLDRGEHLRVK